MDGWMDGWMDEWSGWTDEWMDTFKDYILVLDFHLYQSYSTINEKWY